MRVYLPPCAVDVGLVGRFVRFEGGCVVATVKWFDLSRFGARLRIVPSSPLRGTALTCLDVYDDSAFTSGWQWDGTRTKRETLQEAWRDACTRLDFGHKSTTFQEKQPDGREVRIVRFVSPRLQFALKDIQALVFGVQASDLQEMEVEDIAWRVTPCPGNARNLAAVRQ